MPRKTYPIPLAGGGYLVAASMRPRPDAAENAKMKARRWRRFPLLQ